MKSPMSKRSVLACVILLAGLHGPLFATDDTTLSITQVRVDRQQLVPEQSAVNVQFTLGQPAKLALRWFDGRDLLVREITTEQSLSAGQHVLSWDGRDQAGERAPDEVYRYVLTATNAAGETIVHDLTDNTFGREVRAEQVRWDALSQRIHYRLPQAARVNIRAGLSNNGPLLRTVIDWLPRAAGDHAEPWDGMDQSAVLDLSDHPQLEIAVNAFTLGDNAVIVGQPESVQVIDDPSWTMSQREKSNQPLKRMYAHSQQPLTERGDVSISLTLPDELPVDAAGRPVVSGIVPVRLDVADADRQRALERRFEPVFFIDGAFAFENEVGYLPTTWLWDTRRVSPGPHFINANLRGYEGNFGMATVAVVVAKEQPHE